MSGCAPLAFVADLKRWIRGFFEQNASMIASQIDRNRLVGITIPSSLFLALLCRWFQISKVLSLVHSLVNFGYYGDTEDIRKLLEPMLSLMNGKNDRPFPISGSPADSGANGGEPTSVLSSEVREELDKFREFKRFKKNRENEAVTDAKYEAMKVIDLFLNFRFTTRINRFISEFKSVAENPSDELHPFLSASTVKTSAAYHSLSSSNLCLPTPIDVCRNHKVATKRLHDMFRETEYFGSNFIDVLKVLGLMICRVLLSGFDSLGPSELPAGEGDDGSAGAAQSILLRPRRSLRPMHRHSTPHHSAVPTVLQTR